MKSKQKRKVSKSRIYQLYKRDIDAVGGLIYPDEKFLPVKGESAIWISNYARLLSKRKGKPKISRINHDKDIVGINYAENLMYVPRKLHKALDSIAEINVKKGQKWVVMDYDKAAEFYGISPYDFINAIGNEKYQKPTAKRGKYQYYNKEVGEETPVEINVRIVRETAE